MATPDSDTGFSGRRKGEQWEVCDLCGFVHPQSRMTVQQGVSNGGRVVDVRNCLDEPSREDYLVAQELPTEAPLTFVVDGD